jgi:hypothetical protein
VVLHFLPDAEDPYTVVRRIVDGVPSGSYLVIGHGASDIEPEAAAELSKRYNKLSPTKIRLRGGLEFAPEVLQAVDRLVGAERLGDPPLGFRRGRPVEGQRVGEHDRVGLGVRQVVRPAEHVADR